MDLTGPAGTIEASCQRAATPRGPQAVLCHPHPLYGGTMHDAVLDCAARALLESGVGVLRFNFRGVGRSQGTHDGGRGEVEDLTAAAAWLRSEHPGAPLWLGGYSFGAYVVWQAVRGGLAADRVLLVAPPLGTMPFADEPVPARVDLLAGDADDFIDPRALGAWRSGAVHRVEGADHFFSGRFDALADRLRQIVAMPPEAGC